MQTIKLDLSCYEVPQSILAKQGDVGRKFKVQLTDRNREFIIPEGVKLSVWYSGAAGGGNYSMIGERSAFEVSGNAITVEMITQMLGVSGNGKLCLMLSSSDGTQLGMWNIPYTVEAVPGIDSPAAIQYYTAFSELAAETAKNADAAEHAAEESKKMAQAKVPIGLYSRPTLTVDLNAKTKMFWEEITDIYNSMANGSVELLQANVVSTYNPLDSNEPGNGCFRVTITKSDDTKFGFVEATNYYSSAESWHAPTSLTRIMFNGKWSDTQWPLKNIYNAVCSDLLWTNGSVHTVMGPQIITLPSRARDYDTYLVMVNLDTSIYHTIPVLLRREGAEGTAVAYFPACIHGGKTWAACWRYFFASEDGTSINTSEGYRDGATSNSRAIPYKIYGIHL